MWSAAAAAMLAIGVGATPAAAHNAPISASCEAGLQVSLSGYNGGGVNTVRVWIDGLERGGASFGDSTSSTYSFGDLSVAHTWRVLVTAWDDPTFANGWSFDTSTRNIGVCSEPGTPPAAQTSQPSVAVTTITAPPVVTEPPAPTTTAPATIASTAVPMPSTPDTPVSTVVVAQAAPTTPPTTAPATVPTTVPSGAPAVPVVPSTQGDSEGSLPVTGSFDAGAFGLALLAFGFGILLIVATRRDPA